MIRIFVLSLEFGFCIFEYHIECMEIMSGKFIKFVLFSLNIAIVLNFFTGYYRRGLVVTDRKEIILNYL